MSAFIDDLTAVAKLAAQGLNTPMVPTVVELGENVLNLIKSAKEVVSSTDAPALEALENELGPKVLAHADQTASRLRGE